ncbi:hypothetical protein [Sagittula sp. MA-2]|jgi:hypothetical protein|uniref:hypothetical protein n=1 Tax=Sagittula sp. MA-2 TaxID=3048007 RepID=UPI0024C2547C|nr:hypothetical protein [Sagittula sp. MA-2]WHZ36490.1 hypothetical protein QNI11_05630 [Sagittula sp. MA-2]
MHLSKAPAASPADVPVASIPFRGVELDIYRFTVRDAFEVMNKAPGIVAIWIGDSENRVELLIQEIGRIGLSACFCTLRAGLRASDEELAEAELSMEELIPVILACLDHGVPEEPLGKLFRGVEQLSSRLAKLAR